MGAGGKVLPAVAKHLVMTSLLAHDCEYGQNFSSGIVKFSCTCFAQKGERETQTKYADPLRKEHAS